jgi:hypothetical protein
VLSYGLFSEISFKKPLGTCLATSRFISRAQVGGGRVRAAGKALLNRDDEPVICFAADVGASGRSALHGCNQVRVARFGHCETSKKTDCESNFAVP